ncbi:MAG: isochorismatase family cysteine hydrolase [Clostridia bacterium]|nr:isochorismatase family cysteine hydrolase [Clostridia bacterium]
MEKMMNALKAIKTKYEKNETAVIIKNDGTTATFVVDMINDFNYTSLMANPLAVKLIKPLSCFLCAFTNGGKKSDNLIHLNEGHTAESLEFHEYPEHGVLGTDGAKLVSGIIEFPCERIIYKNSTNGFHVDAVKEWLLSHPNIKRIVVCGVLSDICVMQFVLAIKTYCNQINREMEVIVPEHLVESYEAEEHNRDLFYYMSLEIMAQAGCIIANEVKVEN